MVSNCRIFMNKIIGREIIKFACLYLSGRNGGAISRPDLVEQKNHSNLVMDPLKLVFRMTLFSHERQLSNKVATRYLMRLIYENCQFDWLFWANYSCDFPISGDTPYGRCVAKNICIHWSSVCLCWVIIFRRILESNQLIKSARLSSSSKQLQTLNDCSYH
jgi:hypothetical protein